MRKELYVSNTEEEVIKKLKSVSNVSRYLVELVKQDLGGKKMLTEEQVIALILKYTQNKNTTFAVGESDLESSIQSVLDILDDGEC